jgi:phage gpG-like protein
MPGDFSALKDSLGGLGSPDLGTALRAGIAIEAERQLLAEFRQSRDPYGDPWAAVHRRGPRGRAGKPLVDTSNLMNSRVVMPVGEDVEVGLAAPYASYQQFGTKPFDVAERGARQNKRGRFVSASAKTAFLLRIRAHKHPGIRARIMLPTEKRGLSAIWAKAFLRTVKRVMRERAKGAV